ncbi:hypothetical protein MJ904_26160 [Massilia sp. MB5]|uniref:hypothetical protein n=1 Tax=Massilia sp. MB5 TaxID=2919578 RepID=UPI001F0D8E85|nr:hypothetical protein [Massilia sp. MB5]UMR30422.1 hypothetical protein MJ904_26160 [Massilia sp. MB5]
MEQPNQATPQSMPGASQHLAALTLAGATVAVLIWLLSAIIADYRDTSPDDDSPFLPEERERQAEIVASDMQRKARAIVDAPLQSLGRGAAGQSRGKQRN